MAFMRRRAVLLGLGASVALAVVGVGALYRRDLAVARRGMDPSLSRMTDTRHGPMEYAIRGEGPPFLMLHGTGGGFDQGLLFADRMVEAGFRVIAPSRFGYLRTPMPATAGAAAEAEAIADLLDALGHDRVAVAGGSAGAIPALAFAERFPDRCGALFPIVPAMFRPGQPPVEPWSPLTEKVVRAALGSNLVFWSGARFAKRQVIRSILATDPNLYDAADADERERVDQIVRGLLPMSARADGLLYDGVQANTPQEFELAQITAPTLAISCADDRYLTARNALYIAAAIPKAESLIFPDGGHVWIGRDEALWQAVADFIRDRGKF